MKGFPDRLREARIAAGLTQEQLGFALGVTKSSVSAWENGRETPSFRFLPRLAQMLGCSLDELLGPSQEAKVISRGDRPVHHMSRTMPSVSPDVSGEGREARSPDELALLRRFRLMSPPRRKALLELLRPDAGNEFPEDMAEEA